MKKLVFATNNKHKLAEIRAILKDSVEVVSLSDIDCHDDIPETADTLEGNALIKEVEALGGAPGVYSARYAGEHCSFEDNINKLLNALQEEPAPRRASFRTIVALIDETGEHLFEGKIDGTILQERSGSSGFGYDPIFMPEGYDKSYAALGDAVKNKIRHRARAKAILTEDLLSK